MMSTDQIQAYSAIAQTVIAFLSVILSGAVAYLVYRGTKVIAALEHSRALKEAWMTFDAAALANDDLLVAADELMDLGTRGDALALRRKRWLGFMVLNILAS